MTQLKLAERRVAEQLSVFVAGPLIRKSWNKAAIMKQTPATRLRLRMKSLIENKLRHKVVFGEHRGLSDMGKAGFGSLTNAAIEEIAVIADCDAIVIIPASVGSFCELGAWANREDYCRKMLIVADRKYRKHKSYINLGTFKMAINNGATIEWCDIEDESDVLPRVEEFVTQAHNRAMIRVVNRGA